MEGNSDSAVMALIGSASLMQYDVQCAALRGDYIWYFKISLLFTHTFADKVLRMK